MRDVDVRLALLKEIGRLHPDPEETLVVEELGVRQGLARVDVAVVNGSLHGFEIKSAQDTLTRLERQSEIYSEVFEYVTIVAAVMHLPAIRDRVPKWWGVWGVVEGKALTFTKERQAVCNPAISREALVQLLWRDEALAILDEYGMSVGLRSKGRREIWGRLAAEFKVEDLGLMVRSCLKQRGSSWRAPSRPALCDDSPRPFATS